MIHGLLPVIGVILLSFAGAVCSPAASAGGSAGKAGKSAGAEKTLGKGTAVEGVKPVYAGENSFVVEAGKPVSLTLAATGDKPMVFGSEDLPPDLRLELKTGVISGTVASPGTYTFTVTISNRYGAATATLKIEARAS